MSIKKIFLLSLFFQFSFIFSQNVNLNALSTGEIITSGVVYDYSKKDNKENCYRCRKTSKFFGYYIFYDLGRVDQKFKKIEYILMDKNLNPISRNTFKSISNSTFESKNYDIYIYTDKENEKKLTLSSSMQAISSYRYKSLIIKRFIDLSNYSLGKPTFYKDSKYRNLNLDSLVNVSYYDFKKNKVKAQREIIKKSSTVDTFKLQDSHKSLHYISTSRGKRNTYWKRYLDSIKFYDKDDLIWSRKVKYLEKEPKKFSDKTRYNTLYIDQKKDEYALWVSQKDNDHVQIYSLSSNKIKANISLPGHYEGKPINKVVIGDNLYSFVIYPNNSKYYYNTESVYHMYNLDLNSKELKHKEFKWKDASSFIQITKEGRVKNGMLLGMIKNFLLDDGSRVLLMEKYRINLNNKRVSSDFVLFAFDPNFKLTDVKVIPKDKTRSAYWGSTDYLFSQRLEDGEGSVFFYRDQQKDNKKNWNLGIVVIRSGKITHQTIPMTSEKHHLSILPAKEGYMLIREYNEKQNLNQLRLEKLNL